MTAQRKEPRGGPWTAAGRGHGYADFNAFLVKAQPIFACFSRVVQQGVCLIITSIVYIISFSLEAIRSALTDSKE